MNYFPSIVKLHPARKHIKIMKLPPCAYVGSFYLQSLVLKGYSEIKLTNIMHTVYSLQKLQKEK